jgi:hypothetical protein
VIRLCRGFYDIFLPFVRYEAFSSRPFLRYIPPFFLVHIYILYHDSDYLSIQNHTLYKSYALPESTLYQLLTRLDTHLPPRLSTAIPESITPVTSHFIPDYDPRRTIAKPNPTSDIEVIPARYTKAFRNNNINGRRMQEYAPSRVRYLQLLALVSTVRH